MPTSFTPLMRTAGVMLLRKRPVSTGAFIFAERVTMSVARCKSLEFYERTAPEMIGPICHVLEKPIIELQLVNPNIKVTALKLPPRKSPDEIPCQWELKLEPKSP